MKSPYSLELVIEDQELAVDEFTIDLGLITDSDEYLLTQRWLERIEAMPGLSIIGIKRDGVSVDLREVYGP